MRRQSRDEVGPQLLTTSSLMDCISCRALVKVTASRHDVSTPAGLAQPEEILKAAEKVLWAPALFGAKQIRYS
jgi:hypothetical protein